MPRGKRSNKQRGKKNRHGKKRRNMKKSGMSIRYMPTLVPDRLRTKLNVGEYFSDDFSSVQGLYIFKLNSMSSPFAPASSMAQPAGFANWNNFYLRYRVLWSGLSVIITNKMTDTYTYCIYPSESSSTIPGSVIAAKNQPFSRWTAAGPTSAVNVKRLKTGIRCDKVFGRSISDNDYFGAGDTDPNILCYWMIYIFSNGGFITSSFEVTQHFFL